MQETQLHQPPIDQETAEPAYEVLQNPASKYPPESSAFTLRTRGGWLFDSPKNVSIEKLNAYAEAIDEIVDTISQFEPQIIEKLPNEVNFTYFYQKVLELAKEPKVREMLVRTVADALVKTGDTRNILTLLSSNDDLNLPELQNSKYIGSLLEIAQRNDNSFEEYWLVRRVAELERDGELKTKLFKHDGDVGTTPAEYKYQFGWQERELALLERRSTEALALMAKNPEATIYENQDLYLELTFINTDWQARELFHGKERTILAQEIFTALYKMLERSGSAGNYMVEKAKEWGVTIKKTTPDDEVTPARLRRHLGLSLLSRFRRNNSRTAA